MKIWKIRDFKPVQILHGSSLKLRIIWLWVLSDGLLALSSCCYVWYNVKTNPNYCHQVHWYTGQLAILLSVLLPFCQTWSFPIGQPFCVNYHLVGTVVNPEKFRIYSPNVAVEQHWIRTIISPLGNFLIHSSDHTFFDSAS